MNASNHESRRGLIFILLWVISTSGAYVLTGEIVAHIDPILLCFGIFILASSFFLCLNGKNNKALFLRIPANIGNIVLVNIMTLGCWVFAIFPLKFIEPSIVGSISTSTLPIATIILGAFLYRSQNIYKSDYVVSTLLVTGILFLFFICITQRSSFHYVEPMKVFLGFVFCMTSATFLAATTIFTKKLSNKGFSPIDILSFRFLLTVIFTGIFSYKTLNQLIEPNFLLSIFIVSISLIIIPQIFFQHAIKSLQPITIALVSPLMPVLTFFMQFLNKQLHPSFWSIISIGYLCIIVISSSIIRYKKM